MGFPRPISTMGDGFPHQQAIVRHQQNVEELIQLCSAGDSTRCHRLRIQSYKTAPILSPKTHIRHQPQTQVVTWTSDRLAIDLAVL